MATFRLACITNSLTRCPLSPPREARIFEPLGVFDAELLRESVF
jgi:hypothetical protein